MTQTTDTREKMIPLLQALVDGEMDDARRAELAALLHDDEAAQRYYADYMVLHSMLQPEVRWEHEVRSADGRGRTDGAADLLLAEVMAEAAADDDDSEDAALARDHEHAALLARHQRRVAIRRRRGPGELKTQFGRNALTATITLGLIALAVALLTINVVSNPERWETKVDLGDPVATLVDARDAEWETTTLPTDVGA